MNYRELAEAIDRPYNTVRKWRGEITKISGNEFKRIKVRNGRGRKNRTTYDFNELDVKCFKELDGLLKTGTNKVEAIYEVFGNKEFEELQKQKSDFEILERKSQALRRQIVALSKRIQDQQSELDTLKTKTSDLTERIETLEKRGIKNIFNKK
jgi:predicted  nucleic acid-binding Zn-ribbon protein